MERERERCNFLIWSGYSFQCQHGPAECQGNIYHACVVERVEDQARMLEMIKCQLSVYISVL